MVSTPLMSLLTGHLSTPVIINTRHKFSFLLTAWLYGGGVGGGGKGGVAVTASASHQSGPTSNPGCALNIIWVEFCWWFSSLLPDVFFQIHFQPALPTFNLIHNRRRRTMLLSATTKLLLLNTFFCSFLFPWSVNVTLDPQTRLFSKWREIMIILF